MATPSENYLSYLETIKGDFTKIAKLEFLNEDGTVAFVMDSNPNNERSGAWIQDGSFSCNRNNGKRRQMTVKLDNANEDYTFEIGHIWFGQQIDYFEGVILPDGTEFYIQQGRFEIEKPQDALNPTGRTAEFSLVDKWANLDGTLFGNLEDVYQVNAGTNIFAALASLLKLDKYTMENSGANPIDPTDPIFTEYYNNRTQTLTDGTTVPLIEAPHDYISNSTDTLASVVTGLTDMIAGEVGYNSTGRLFVNPSQDDISDIGKPVMWDFTLNEKPLLGVNYAPKITEIYNDIIVVGATNDLNVTARGRAQNTNPKSPTCISRIGRKTKRIKMSNYYSDKMCRDYANWMLKRYSTLAAEIQITCTQMFHIRENDLVTIRRTDKPGAPVERHLVTGFTRPVGQTGSMTINCVSVDDLAAVQKTYSGSGASVSFYNNGTAEIVSLSVELAAQQAGSGDPSPSNVRPISGFPSITLNVSGADTTNPTQYAFTFGDPPGTVYGGTLNVLTGELTVTHKIMTVAWGDGIGATDLGNYVRKLFRLSGHRYAAADEAEYKCSVAPYVRNYTLDSLHYYAGSTGLFVYLPEDTASDFTFSILYPLAEEETYSLTAQSPELLEGTNNIWADTGTTVSVTISYME